MLLQIYFFTFLTIVASSTIYPNCPTISTDKTKWTSDDNFDNQLVITELLCLNNNNELVTRVCANVNDSSTHVCVELQNEDRGFWFRNSTKTIESRTKLVLSFEEEKKELYLLVYSPEDILQREDAIFCFTNAAQTDLKRKVKIQFRYKNFDKTPNLDSFLVFKVKIQKYLGEYWCEAFTKSLSLLRSGRVLAYQRKKGNEYSLRIVIDNICKMCSCNFDKLFICLVDEKLKQVFQGFSPEVRIMEVFDFDTYKDVLDILVHVSTGKTYNVDLEYPLLLSQLRKHKDMKTIFFRSSEFCLSDRITLDGIKLTWSLTKIGTRSVPEEFCFLKSGIPMVRRCEGDFFYGGVWSNTTGHCIENPPISDATIKLKEMATSEVSVGRVWATIKDVSLSIIDIYYLNVVLSRIRGNDSFFAFNFVNKLMTMDHRILEKSQNLLNLTDSTLESTDDILSDLTPTSDSVYLDKREKLIVHVTNPFRTNISGLLLYGNLRTPLVVNFKRGDNFDEVDRQNLHLAVYVPEIILEQLLNETENNVSDIFIITTIFFNDNLFVDDRYHSGSFVISVTIPGYGSYLQSSIPIIFESKNSSKLCGFWDNGKKTNWKKGQWSHLGSTYVRELGNDHHMCSFVHLTHFALLVMSDRKNLADEEEEIVGTDFDEFGESSLEIMTQIGCSFSIVGIVGIFLTAILFKKWRDKIGTKILLNLSVAILLEIICVNLSAIKDLKTSEKVCKIIGMVLHYVVLSKFSWTLIYALLQYYRFVKVIATIPNNLILKSVIVGWGIPLAVVFLVGLLTTQSYVSSSYELCYPRGLLLYLTVLMPVCVIILANLTIFCLVMYNVTYKINVSTNKKLFRLRLYLALLLFSVLGMPWVFGILAELMYFSLLKVVLFHMFCITATLQGFVLFLFYVVLNKETRELWLRYLRTRFVRYCK